MEGQELPYDPTDQRSIILHAEKLLGKTFREAVGDELGGGKGNLGQLIEKKHFRYAPNSRPTADFEQAELEVKTTPLKTLKKGAVVPKERIVLNVIDFDELATESWDGASFLDKNRNLLFIFYLHEADKDLLDLVINRVVVWRFDRLPASDQAIIRSDWQLIVDKVRSGGAALLSEGDTMYLGACTKGADSSQMRSAPGGDAKRRAFCLKQKYIRAILSEDARARELFPAGTPDFAASVAELFLPYLGKTPTELAAAFNIGMERKPKNLFATISRRIIESILGEDPARIAEFRKAGVTVKTVRVKHGGTIKESISFPYIRFARLEKEDWEDSDLYEILTGKFLFVVFHDDLVGEPFLSDAFLWSMPGTDLEEAHRVWSLTRDLVLAHRTDNLPKMADSPIVHVRPHGRRRSDTTVDLRGVSARKQGFWLNATYIRDVIKKHREERKAKPRG